MNRREAQLQVKEVVEVRDMIQQADPGAKYPYSSMVVLRDLLLDEVNRRDHGERDALFMPQWNAKKRIERLGEEYSKAQFKSAFKTVKGKLLSIANRYIREMHKGIEELFQ